MSPALVRHARAVLRRAAVAGVAGGAVTVMTAITAGSGLAVAAPTSAPPSPPPSASSASSASSATGLALTVTDVTPSTVAPGTSGSVTFSVRITNGTSQPATGVTLGFRRGAPIDDERALDAALANPRPSDPSLSTTPQYRPLALPIAAHASTTVSYTATVSRQTDSDICLCKPPGTIYPIEFSAVVGGAARGFTETYLPAFEQATRPVPVGWVWPLIDKPHRSTEDTVFTDDTLASSFADGRLARLLQVAELLPPTVRLTLVVDPELIDEAAVMASGTYRVQTATGLVAGTGRAAAASWLARLTALRSRDELSLTPWADPDVEALTGAGLPWSPGVTAAERARVAAALGIPASAPDVVGAVFWPPADTATAAVLAQAGSRGAQVAVLDDATLPGAATARPRPSSYAEIPGSSVHAVVTDAGAQRLLGGVLSTAPGGADVLPALLARVALRATEEPDQPSYLVLAPNRYLDPDVGRATRALAETSSSFFTTSLPVGSAPNALQPVYRGRLSVPAGATEGQLPAGNLAAAEHATLAAQTITSAVPAAQLTTVLDGLPAAVRRAESASWRTDSAGAAAIAVRVDALATALDSSVSIVQPAQGSYTLGSSDSFLFVTVNNQLAAPATVRLSMSTLGGVAGFSAEDVTEQVPPATRLTLRVAVHAVRSGRFQVVGHLSTPAGQPLGSPLRVTVNSTSLGGIGVVITAVAAGVLALALCLRVLRRLLAGRSPLGRRT